MDNLSGRGRHLMVKKGNGRENSTWVDGVSYEFTTAAAVAVVVVEGEGGGRRGKEEGREGVKQ